MPVNVVPLLAVTLINLTPHAIHVLDDNENLLFTLDKPKPEVMLPRVKQDRTLVESFNGSPVFVTTTGDVLYVPEPQEGVAYVVSVLVRTSLPNRRDLLSPGLQVRNDVGHVKGCLGFDRNP